MITIPLLWISSAGGTVFWIVGASLCIILAHAAMMPVPGADNPLNDLL